MALLAADSFDRIDNAVLGSTNGAGSLDPLAWTAQSGTWGIASNLARTSRLGGALLSQATIDVSAADVDLSVIVPTLVTGTAALMFRYSNTTNFWYWSVVGTGVSRLFKVVANVFTQIGTDQSGAAAGDTLRVVAVGSAIEVFRNGVSKITTTDSHNQTATKHGMYSTATGQRFNQFSVSDPTTTVVGGQATETDTGISGTLLSVVLGNIPALTYSLDTPSAAAAAGYMVLG